MQLLVFFILLFCSSLVSAQECGEPSAKHWRTGVKLDTVQVTLHWTTVYEGIDTVCAITYNTSRGKPQVLEVYGQPEVNTKQDLLGFVTCADDGCEKQIQIADIARGVVLKANLSITAHQSYLKAKWKDNNRELLIDVKSFSNGKALSPSRFLCAVSDSVQCARAF
jgi:hypothetical protein